MLHKNASYDISMRVLWPTCASHVTYMQESCVTHMKNLFHMCVWHRTPACMWLDSRMRVTRLTYWKSWFQHVVVCVRDSFIYMCDRTHAYMWHDEFICLTWFMHAYFMTGSSVYRDSFTGDSCPWLIHMFDVTHLTRLNHMWGDSCVWHDSCTCVTWLVHTRETTLSSQNSMKQTSSGAL